jgi:hypothetical protein
MIVFGNFFNDWGISGDDLYQCNSSEFVSKCTRKTMKDITDYSQCIGRDSNRAPPECKSVALLFKPTCSILDCKGLETRTVCSACDVMVNVRKSYPSVMLWITV